MSHKNKLSLVGQVEDMLMSKLCIGQSKHQAKLDGTSQNGIYSWDTFRNYMKHCNYFVNYCKSEHGCRTISDCRQYVDEWLSVRVATKSAYTVKLEASALAKLYSCSTKDFISTPSRDRDNIVRSRGVVARDKHFSELNNADLVSFCKSTGLRRSELQALKGTALTFIDGQPYLHVTEGTKGSRERFAPIIGDISLVIEKCRVAGSKHVWEHIHNAADIHSYRADYATAVYNANARSLTVCKATPFWDKSKHRMCKDSVYYLRGSHKGKWLDKQAMLVASQALGHNRISVVGEHYIHV